MVPSEVLIPFVVHPKLGRTHIYCDPKVFPKDQTIEACHLVSYSGHAWKAVLRFSKALDLFEYARKNNDRWKEIAARDAVWAVYNLLEAVEFFRSNIKDGPLRDKIEHDKIRESSRLHRKYFPDAKAFRDAIAHIPEWTQTMDATERNAYRGCYVSDGMVLPDPNSSIIFDADFLGDEFRTVAKGRLLKCNINQDSLQKLIEIKEIFFSSLLSVEEESIPLMGRIDY